jgi:hypothetical protein
VLNTSASLIDIKDSSTLPHTMPLGVVTRLGGPRAFAGASPGAGRDNLRWKAHALRALGALVGMIPASLIGVHRCHTKIAMFATGRQPSTSQVVSSYYCRPNRPVE